MSFAWFACSWGTDDKYLGPGSENFRAQISSLYNAFSWSISLLTQAQPRIHSFLLVIRSGYIPLKRLVQFYPALQNDCTDMTGMEESEHKGCFTFCLWTGKYSVASLPLDISSSLACLQLLHSHSRQRNPVDQNQRYFCYVLPTSFQQTGTA